MTIYYFAEDIENVTGAHYVMEFDSEGDDSFTKKFLAGNSNPKVTNTGKALYYFDFHQIGFPAASFNKGYDKIDLSEINEINEDNFNFETELRVKTPYYDPNKPMQDFFNPKPKSYYTILTFNDGYEEVQIRFEGEQDFTKEDFIFKK